MKVKALMLGFYGGSRRRIGDIFEIKEGELGRWMEVVDADEAEEVVVAKPKAQKAKAPKQQAPEPVEVEAEPAVSTGDQEVI